MRLKVSQGRQINAGSSGAGASRYTSTDTDGLSFYFESKCTYDGRSRG